MPSSSPARGGGTPTHLKIRSGGSTAFDEVLYDTPTSCGPRAHEQLVSLHSLQEVFQWSNNLWGEDIGKSVPAREREAKGHGTHAPC